MNARTLIALLLAAAGTGCVDNNASVVISSACFPPAPSDTGSCVYAATCDAVWLGNVSVDATFTPAGRPPLVWPMQLENHRPDNAARDGGTSTATAAVTGFKLKIVSGPVSIPEISVPWTQQSILPLGTTVLIVPILPAATKTLLMALPNPTQIVVEVKATGEYGDGSSFETGPFSMVVDVRNGGYVLPTCVAPAAYVASCPQEGQSGIPLCK
jgi:hypothetical protein